MTNSKQINTKLEAKQVIALIATLAIGFLAGWQIDIKLFRPNTTETVEKTVEVMVDVGPAIELSAEDKPVEVGEGVLPLVGEDDIKTIEAVDGGRLQIEDDKVYDDIINARGAYYRTDTLAHFIEDTKNKCVTEGNIWGAQCVSQAQAFWESYAGFGLDTCGTNAARGIWTCREKNAGDAFEYTEDISKVIPGAWVVTDDGDWGHITQAVGVVKDGYLPVYGENQGGTPCPEGGAQPNFINLSMKNFLGAFIPKSYIPSEPEPEPEAPDTGVAK